MNRRFFTPRLILVLVGFTAVTLMTFVMDAPASPLLPNINTNNVITVTNAPYNAVGDGVITNTTAIQTAITAAAAGGTTNGLSGGTVRIPSPGTFLCGPLTFANNVNLQIDAGAKLLMLPQAKYPGGIVSPANFIQGTSLHDVEISGSGTIDGQGLPWWEVAGTNSSAVRPNMVNFSTCTRILIQNVTLSNSPSPFLVVKGKAGNVTIQGVTILAPSSSASPPSHNTDAIDLAETNAVIQNCFISTGDDNVAIGSSASVSKDILITNCVFGEGHGVSIGSFTSGGVSNLTVINCTFNGTDNGIRLKSRRDRGGLIQNLNYLNLGMTNVDWPLLIYSYYEFGLGTITGVTPYFASTNVGAGASPPIWQNITFSNITATSFSSRPPLMLWGLHELVISNVVFSHVNITSSSTKSPGIYNATAIQFIDSQFNLSAAPSTFLLYNADVVFTNSAPTTNLIKLDGLSTNFLSNGLQFYNAQATVKNTNVFDTVPLTLCGSTLTVSNNFNLASLSALNFVLGTNAAKVAVVGNLALNGTISVTAGGGFTNGAYTLLTYTGNLSGAMPALGGTPSGYICVLNTNTVGQVNLLVSLPPPGTPTNLTAFGTNLLINLKWFAATNATAYNLKRSTTNGGPYAIIASVAVTNYSDAAVLSAVTYFYVVSATNSFGESTNSLQASAAPLPSASPTNVVLQTSASQLQLLWPQDHTGWRLQIQTNNLSKGLGTNWTTVSNSIATNKVFIPINLTNGGVFLRLIYP